MSQPVPVRTSSSRNGDGPGARAGGEPATPRLGQTGPPLFTQDEIEGIDQLLPYLSYIHGELALDGTPVSDLWDGGRSMLLYVPERAVDNYRSVAAAFGQYFDVSVNCAMKACYVGGVLSALRAAGAGVEVASELEWRAARAVGFAPARTVVNGMCRQAEYLERLLGEEGLLIDIDSSEELERVEWHAARLGVRPTVMVRVNPLPPDMFFSERSKLGVGSDTIIELLERLVRSPHMDLRGLHAHQLVRCTDPEQFGVLARRMGALREEFSSTGAVLDTLDLGGGIEARYLLERGGHTIGEFAEAAREALGGVDGLRLLLEPGRYVFGDAAVALTRVLGSKRKEGHRWLIADIGSNLLPPTSDRAYPPLPVRLGDGDEWERFHVADPTPTPARLYLDALLPADAAREGVVLIGVGAYTAVRASVWSSGLPDIAFLRDDQVEVVFDRAAQDAAFRSLYGVDLNAPA